MDYPLSSRFFITVFVLVLLVIWVLRQLLSQGLIGFQAYALALSSAVLIIIVFSARKTFKEIPPDSGTVSEKSVAVNASFERVCEAVPDVVAKNRWKLLEADKRQGHFKAKIGMSLMTWSSTLLIDVTRMDGGSVNVHAFCGTRSLYAQGYIESMIAKFYRGLENSLESPKV